MSAKHNLNWENDIIPPRRLLASELIDLLETLPPEDILQANALGNMSIYRWVDNRVMFVGYIDFAFGEVQVEARNE